MAHNPAQQEVVDRLGSSRERWPEFPAELRHELRAELDEALGPLAGGVEPGEVVSVAKHALAGAHGCEVRFLAEDSAPFEVNPWVARGAVAHKAIELTVHWRTEPDPLDLVDEAMARLAEDDRWLSDWLQTCGEADRAELRAAANERVAKFAECWPPLSARWRPVTEATLTAPLCEGRVVLRGKVDLTLGAAEGTRAGKVIVDFKTGGHSPHHGADLRFYALIEALRVGVPPRQLATYYLDSGTMETEAVTASLLESTVARVVDGIELIAALRSGMREPVAKPSPRCRWCPVRPGCEPGERFLAEVDSSGPL